MKKVLAIFSIVILILLLAPSAIVFADESNPYTYYVDANAKDGGDGSSKHPFKTIKQAQEHVRSISIEERKTSTPAIIIKDGIYYIDETLTFTEEDSFASYGAASGANPILCGGDLIEGKWQDEGNGIYSIPYNRDKKLRSLYVNGKRCYMTSKTIQGMGSTGSYSVTKDSAPWAWEDVQAKSGVKLFTKELDENTRNQDDIELMTQTTWNTTIVCVESLEKSGGSIIANLQMPYAAIAQNLTSSNAYKFSGQNTVYNVFEWLDEEGEFYFDKTEKKLYYKPREGENLKKATVIAPKVETIINIEGTDKDHKVENLSFYGLKFAYTDWSLVEIDGSHGRATNQGAAPMVNLYNENQDGTVFHNSIYRAYDVGPATVMMQSADNIKFSNNVICHTGNDALSMPNDVTNVKAEGNIIYDIAGTSLLIGHPQHMYIGDKGSSKGIFSDKELYDVNKEALCEKIEITNTYISDIGVLFAGNPGVMIYAGKDIAFEHNIVQNVPYSGISIGWGWWNMNGNIDSVVPGEPMACTSNIKILSNKFLNSLTKLSDGGAIYTLGAMEGTKISNNYIKDVAVGKEKPEVDKIRGIHLDEGSAYIYGEKNVIDVDIRFACIDCGLWGSVNGSQHDNDWDNNYTRNDRYTTWGEAPGCDITNEHVDENAIWDENATAIINAAGVGSKYLSAIDIELKRDGTEFKKSNIGLIITLSLVGGVAVLAGVGVGVYFAIKKRKNVAKIETQKA